MANGKNIEAREAKYGEKMVEVKVRFWTDSISSEVGKVIPKHALTSGVVRIKGNKSHGIAAGKPTPFNSLLDIGTAIEKTLIENGITLHLSGGMRDTYRRSQRRAAAWLRPAGERQGRDLHAPTRRLVVFHVARDRAIAPQAGPCAADWSRCRK